MIVSFMYKLSIPLIVNGRQEQSVDTGRSCSDSQYLCSNSLLRVLPFFYAQDCIQIFMVAHDTGMKDIICEGCRLYVKGE